MRNTFVHMLHFLRSVSGKYPFHLFLLPVFFIASKYTQYAGLLDMKVTIGAWLLVTLILLVLSFALNFFWHAFQKAAALVTCLSIVFLFFGGFRESLQHSNFLHFLSAYKFLLPFLTLVYILLLLHIKKRNTVVRLTQYLNLFLLLVCCMEAVKIIAQNKQLHRAGEPQMLTSIMNDSMKKQLPDIYFIVPDAYPSTSYQSEVLHSDNTAFDDSLQSKGFRVLVNSKSNYNRTIFSMLGTFNMDYLNWLHHAQAINSKDFNRSMQEINNARLFSFLKEHHYNIVNLSIFDINHQQALRKELFLSVTTWEMIFRFTFGTYFSRDISYHWFTDKKDHLKKNQLALYSPLKTYSAKVVDSLLKMDSKKRSNPAFVYAHLSFPHYPYFYDSTGKPYLNESIFTDSMITDKKKFAGYIKYSNQQLLKIISAIQEKNTKNKVIIIQSDHGIADLDPTRKLDAFRNYSAFYFSDHDYQTLYDSMSNVNTFRIILNKYFAQKLQLLPDSSTYTLFR